MDENKEATALPESQEGMVDISSRRKRSRQTPMPKKKSWFLWADGTVDRVMLLIILLLISFGSVMVYSASYAYAYSRYDDSTYFIKRQLIFVLIGFAVMLLVSHLHYKMFKLGALPLYAVSLGLLVLVLVIGIAAQAAKRWLQIGSFSFQPSEIMKIALILALAWYGDRYRKQLHDQTLTFKQKTVTGLLKPGAIVLLAAGLVALENHVSGTLIMLMIGIICLWAIGTDRRWFIWIGGGGLLLVGLVLLIVWFKDASWNKLDDIMPAYVVRRIDIWLRPDNYTILDDTWQTMQGKYAVGSGGFFGVGFGKSYQKHLFVSQPQNDFIFAIVCEELGFVGALFLIGLYLVFIYRGLVIAKRAPDVFSSVTAVGIVGHVGIQALLNMLVVTGVFPNTGISLPFISYGGTSLVMLMAEMGILLSISRASRMDK